MNNKVSAAILPVFLRVVASIILIGLIACKEDESHQPELSISGFQPSTGPFSTIVTIEGTGFNKNPSSNIVKFNNMLATVKSVTAEQLMVEVPKGAGTGKVTVQNNSKTAMGGDFTYVYTVSVSTLAGHSSGLYGGYADGQGSSTQFRSPSGVATDAQGNIYVTDTFNNRIRMVSPDGTVSTFAGTAVAGHKDGHRSIAEFYLPTGIAVDVQGNIYVGEFTRIRKITPDGMVSTLAGSSEPGFADGQGSGARFRGTFSITTDPQGNLYVADTDNLRIRKVTPDGLVSTFAGSGAPGMADGNSSTATFTFPMGLARDVEGNFYIAEKGNQLIRKISTDGTVSTLAGKRHGYPGYVDGEGNTAQFNTPLSLTVAPSGNIYVSDSYNHIIRQITPDGMVSTLAGSKAFGWADGDGSAARFLFPVGITTDAQGDIYVADSNNHKIRKITME